MWLQGSRNQAWWKEDAEQPAAPKPFDAWVPCPWTSEDVKGREARVGSCLWGACGRDGAGTKRRGRSPHIWFAKGLRGRQDLWVNLISGRANAHVHFASVCLQMHGRFHCKEPWGVHEEQVTSASIQFFRCRDHGTQKPRGHGRAHAGHLRGLRGAWESVSGHRLQQVLVEDRVSDRDKRVSASPGPAPRFH